MTGGPFGTYANDIYRAGWHGVFLLPAGQKAPPPIGATGAGGRSASGADTWATAEEHPEGNIGIRLPPTVLGIDVDHYDGKAGKATWDNFITRCGPLERTWTLTSRTDGTSGIRLYRVPPGMHWPGELGPGVELIQVRHRYVVGPGSNHPEGRVYQWISPTGNRSTTDHPSPDMLPLLAEPWVQELTGGRLAVETVKTAPGTAASIDWYTSAVNNAPACRAVRTATAQALHDICSGETARHDAAMRVVMQLCYLSTEGHHGVVPAIEAVRSGWYFEVTAATGKRTGDEADREWRRIVSGALAVLQAEGGLDHHEPDDPCDPLAGLLPPGDTTDAPVPAGAPDAGLAPEQADTQVAFDLLVTRAAFNLRVQRAARELVEREDNPWRPPPYLPSMADELALPDEPVAYLVDEVLPVGANVVLTAAFKSGKTTLVNHLVRCLVDEEMFLGRYGVHPAAGGRVALWNYEVSGHQYRRWLRQGNFRNPDRVSVLNLRGFTMPVRQPLVMQWAVEWLIRYKITTWIIDPLARAFLGNGQSENDNTEMGMFLETLDSIKELSGVQELIIPAHTGRAIQEAGTERSRGATRVDDWADVRWLLTKDIEGTRFFRTSGRDVETPEGTLDYDPLMRNLVLLDGGRESPAPGVGGEGALYDAILRACIAHPGIGAKGLRDYVRNAAIKAGNEKIDNAVNLLVQQGRMTVSAAAMGRQRGHFANENVGK